MTSQRKEIADFLSNNPLYSKKVIDNFSFGLCKLDTYTYKYYCNICQDNTTFELLVYPKKTTFNVGESNSIVFHVPIIFSLDEHNNLNPAEHYKGTCKQCNKYYMDFLILTHVKDDIVTLTKIGQNPPIDIKPNKTIHKYLRDEDRDYYKKALMCHSQGYNIGSFSYFRRVVENEIKRIVKDLAGIDVPEDGKATDWMDEAYKALPETLRNLGFNPIEKLYGTLSIGIHGLPEEKCLEYSTKIQSLLEFMIKKIVEEKGQVSDLRKMWGS